MKPDVVHVIDQSDQPYGSVRLCCNRCGAMRTSEMTYVTTISAWVDDRNNCSRVAGDPDRHLHDHSVLHVCATLHGVFTGTCLGSVEDVREVLEWLEWRMRQWERSPDKATIGQVMVESTIHQLAWQVIMNARTWLRDHGAMP